MPSNSRITSYNVCYTKLLRYAPLYYFAYQLGARVLGISPHPEVAEAPVIETFSQWMTHAWQWVEGIGQPLLLGMLMMAVVGAAVGYVLAQALWGYHVMRKRRARLRHRTHA